MRLPLALLSALLCAFVCHAETAVSDPYQPQPYVKLKHPEWSKNATIYQLNTRQFSKEGTFRAAESQLQRIKDLNVDIIWLMPIHEIGVKNRKGILGSPYAVKDYFSVNHEFGTLEDLKHFVAEAHKLGMKVILDWVANHTAWDNAMATEHPDWYDHDPKGNFRPTPWFDWDDIINLNYNSPGLRRYMTGALKYWVKEADIDGYRCDVAGFVPVDFWNNARKELDAIKPVFMLAEWETRDLHAEAFDMTYAWSWYERLHEITTKGADLGGLFGYLSWNECHFPVDTIRMNFVSNHDKNSWDGTEFEQFGEGLDAAIIFSVACDGMPLIYNGQEAGNTKRLKFFERDPIEWKASPYAELYRKLFALKHENTALWNGHWGSKMLKVTNTADNRVLSFVRFNSKDKVFAVFNFSKDPQKVSFKDDLHWGTYKDYLSGKSATFDAKSELILAPWESHLFVK